MRPPYIEHNTKAVDGIGELLVSSQVPHCQPHEQHGSYTLSAFVLTTVPTGTYKERIDERQRGANARGRKGVRASGRAVDTGATLPTGSQATATSGRPIGWNTAVQYHIGKLFFPEVESNATYYKGGTNDGRMQEFLTPGIVIGKCALHPERPQSRPGLAFGGGMQIATGHFHAYNHALILTARWIY